MSPEHIVICGAPRAGKTTLAETFDRTVMHTDDLITMGWSEASELIATDWLRRPSPWVIEGVAAVRGLRKYLDFFASKPCDEVIYMPTPRLALSAGQAAMAKGVATIWAQIQPELERRGVRCS